MARIAAHGITCLCALMAVVVCFGGGAEAGRSLLQSTCANPTLPDVNIPMYLGVWYEIGSTTLVKIRTEANLVCITARYSLIEYGPEAQSIRVRNDGYNVSSGEYQWVLGTATVIGRKLGVSFNGGPPADYRIIHLSGDALERYSTAIVYSCDSTPGSYQSLYILSRKPELDDDETVESLLAIAANAGITLEPNNQFGLTAQDAITCGRND